jgi:hypothetical protein
MSKVYLVTEPITYKNGKAEVMFDITPALEYGELVTLTKHNHSMIISVPMVRQLRKDLATFCDDDYILPVGDPVTIGTVAAVAADINGGFFKMLKWDKRSRKYIPIEINAWGKELD